MNRQIATLCDVKKECDDAFTMQFSLEQPIEPKPGQCGTFLLLKDDGSFGEGRVYSLSSSPLVHDKVEITVRVTPNFPTKLLQLEKGGRMGFFGPYGNFVYNDAHDKVVFLAGGVGVTPLLSMIHYITGKSLPAKMVLIHSNRSIHSTPFLHFFKRLQTQNPNFKYVLNLTRENESNASWEGEREEGHLTEQLVRKHVPHLLESHYYVCGPPRYIQGAGEVLKALGIPQEKIRMEQW